MKRHDLQGVTLQKWQRPWRILRIRKSLASFTAMPLEHESMKCIHFLELLLRDNIHATDSSPWEFCSISKTEAHLSGLLEGLG